MHHTLMLRIKFRYRMNFDANRGIDLLSAVYAPAVLGLGLAAFGLAAFARFPEGLRDSAFPQNPGLG